MSPEQQATFDQAKVAVHAELDGMIEYWQILRASADFDAALLGLTQSLYDSQPTTDDLVRLVTFAVGRLAEGGASA